jgi:hypothetical protein
MDKIKIQPTALKNVTFNYNGQEVEVIPYMTLIQQGAIINRYLQEMFEDIENNFDKRHSDRIRAEYQLKIIVLDMFTNIDISSIDVENFFIENLYREVTSRILNYGDFESLLFMVVSDYRENETLKNSVGTVLEKASERLYEILSTFSELTPEKVGEMTSSVSGLLEEVKGISKPDALIFPEQQEKPKRKRARRNVKK